MINKKELLFVVDEHNVPGAPLARKEVHEQGRWHRVAHVWVYNSHGEILCQKRSLQKDADPGKWQAFFGGHLPPRTTYLDGALSELTEEIGIPTTPSELVPAFTYRDGRGKEFQGVFGRLWDGDLHALRLEKEEVDEVRFVHPDALLQLFHTKDPSWCFAGYEPDMVRHLLIRAGLKRGI